MKLSAQREIFLEPLQAVIGVVERRQTMPILTNVLLVAKDGHLSVTATDLEVELVASTKIDVEQDGEITVPGRKLLDIFRALPANAKVSLTLDGDRVQIRSGSSRFTLSTLPAAETAASVSRWAPPTGSVRTSSTTPSLESCRDVNRKASAAC